jgi:hypothetical protein
VTAVTRRDLGLDEAGAFGFFIDRCELEKVMGAFS